MSLTFNKAIRILLIVDGIVLIANAMLGPIYALFVEKIGGDLLDVSYAFGAFALTAGIVTFFSGRYSDKVKENELIIALGYGIMGIGFLGYLLVNSIWSLLIVQVIIGLGRAIELPPFDHLYSKHQDGHISGRVWGTWEAMNYFSTALGAIIGGILVTLFGFNLIFVIMGLLCFISSVYIIKLPRKVL